MAIQNAVRALRRVYVRPPVDADLGEWRSFGWHTAPEPARAAAEHEAFRATLADAGAEVVIGRAPVPGDPDAIYAYDPVLPTDDGTILLRPGKEPRRPEVDAVAADLTRTGVPIRGRIEPPGTAEGGDLLWLDAVTLLAGIGYRTNPSGVAQLHEMLEPSGVTVEAFDLPHQSGPTECLHLMSLLSMLDADLAVAYMPLLPVRLVQLLDDRGVTLVPVPDEELPTMGPNVLALAPRIALALEGNPRTRERMEQTGVEVRTYTGEEISRKGDGGPTCLSRPLARG